ncbi:MAG: hypothetical protein KC431_27480, partial [Myxococcales bacterium]|nr:hypothetical protein [Myxococcales bacterium]
MTPLWAVLVPLATAVVVGSVPRNEPGLARGLGVVGAAIELAILLALILGFDPEGAALQFRAAGTWL